MGSAKAAGPLKDFLYPSDSLFDPPDRRSQGKPYISFTGFTKTIAGRCEYTRLIQQMRYKVH